MPAKFLFVTVIIISIALAAGYFFYQNQQLQNSEVPVLTPTPVITKIQDETANWKTYSNSQYKFSLNYPSNLIPNEQSSDIFLFQVNFRSASDEMTPLSVEVRDAKNIEEEIAYRRWRVVGHITDKIDEQKTETASGTKGIRLNYKLLVPKEGDDYYSTVILPFNGHFYSLNGKSTLVDQILSTFKITDSDPPLFSRFQIGNRQENGTFITEDYGGGLKTATGTILSLNAQTSKELYSDAIVYYQDYFKSKGWEFYLSASGPNGNINGWKKNNKYYLVEQKHDRETGKATETIIKFN